MATEDETDINYATPYIYASWALTAIAGLALLFRFAIKSWIQWAYPVSALQTDSGGSKICSTPRVILLTLRILCLCKEGLRLAQATAMPIHLMNVLTKPDSGIISDELRSTLKNEFISQPLGILASMLSRTGMMCFLYSSYNGADRRIRISILVWFNSGIDLFLTALSAIQLWGYTMRATDRRPSHSESFCSRLRKIPRRSRNRRLWQTCALSGPLLLSGIASIIKTWLLKAIEERNDITHNIVPQVLWVKIENYSILLATCAPIIRHLKSSVSNNGSPSKDYPTSGILSGGVSQGLELDMVRHTNDQDTVALAMPVKDTQDGQILSGA
ncbi:hypothetical protein ASPACDRAFT_48451 [Aspergillus aculeatus ATCC 16872]|uniref:Uncharacterized protein n=1 Tax=Aspergillus aculeatus (strain ATCC 16872 / CBS 172.66 / WB 5094) TaxID=690307 RepID=A0A1L9WFS8_ASPA1|nr:uncharacterized protein ASPACDRAFT_48451 [Aspergillus aculeatus ATCC 16872]OJJ95003.1 hypothetical protein ASPACDRAFT_48451 [Aspergillus aculeatus ATCC 16872]